MAQSSEHRAKKRRLEDTGNDIETFKPSARFRPTEPREWTISVAIPASILSDCSTKEQRTVSPGRIARALAVFSVDEVVVFDDRPTGERPRNVDEDEYTGDTDPCHFIAHILSYLETPPFMRKTLYPLHPNLKLQGLLPSLDMPHHPHKDEWLPYREGMTIAGRTETGKGTLVEIGMKAPVHIAESIPPKTRVTLQISGSGNKTSAEPVHPKAPRAEAGYYWGFEVRRAASLSAVFTESPYATAADGDKNDGDEEGGYDLSIGTSERGLPLSQVFPPSSRKRADFQHLLIVFGGPRGLEYAAMNDAELDGMGVAGRRTRELFDHWVNVLPNQGSRTIRTDEAVFIALAGLRRLWDPS